MDWTAILLLVGGFYTGLLLAKSGLTFEKAISPFTGLAKLFGNMLEKLDKSNRKQPAEEEEEDAEEKTTKRKRRRRPL